MVALAVSQACAEDGQIGGQETWVKGVIFLCETLKNRTGSFLVKPQNFLLLA